MPRRKPDMIIKIKPAPWTPAQIINAVAAAIQVVAIILLLLALRRF